jgi:membrane protein implicated in regulation of membrane protease activity
MNLPNIPEWLKISSVHLLAIAIAAGVLIFAPARVLEILGVTGFVAGYRMWVGFVFLVCVALLLARAGAGVFEFAKKRIQQRRTLRRWQRRLHELTPEEKEVLEGYVLENTRTQYFQLEDGVIQGLAAETIITRAASVGDVFKGFAYNIQPWAWRYLKEHPTVLGDAGSSGRVR